jgi:hypothetical protein
MAMRLEMKHCGWPLIFWSALVWFHLMLQWPNFITPNVLIEKEIY